MPGGRGGGRGGNAQPPWGAIQRQLKQLAEACKQAGRPAGAARYPRSQERQPPAQRDGAACEPRGARKLTWSCACGTADNFGWRTTCHGCSQQAPRTEPSVRVRPCTAPAGPPTLAPWAGLLAGAGARPATAETAGPPPQPPAPQAAAAEATPPLPAAAAAAPGDLAGIKAHIAALRPFPEWAQEAARLEAAAAGLQEAERAARPLERRLQSALDSRRNRAEAARRAQEAAAAARTAAEEAQRAAEAADTRAAHPIAEAQAAEQALAEVTAAGAAARLAAAAAGVAALDGAFAAVAAAAAQKGADGLVVLLASGPVGPAADGGAAEGLGAAVDSAMPEAGCAAAGAATGGAPAAAAAAPGAAPPGSPGAEAAAAPGAVPPGCGPGGAARRGATPRSWRQVASAHHAAQARRQVTLRRLALATPADGAARRLAPAVATRAPEGVRAGEASHPGPAFPDVFSGSGQFDAMECELVGVAGAAAADAWCVQEARIPARQASSTSADAWARGLRLQVEPEYGAEHLLAVAHRPGLCGVRAAPPLGVSGRHPGHLQHMVLHFGQARAVHFMNCYGSGGRCDEERNADLILEGLQWLRGLGAVPAFLVGDLNCNLEAVGLAGVMAMAGWRDLLAAARPTCMPTHGTPSRLDCIVANAEAMGMVERISNRWDLGLAMHAALLVTFRASPLEQAWIREPVPALDGVAAELALRVQDLGAAWAVLSTTMRTWLAARQGRLTVPERPQAAAVLRAERAPATRGGGEAADAAADAALLRLRRLRGLRHASARGSVASRGVAMGALAALRAADAGDAFWEPQLAAVQLGAELPEALVQLAGADWATARAAARQRRQNEWHRWVSESLANAQGRLYRWIRGGGTLGAELVPDPATQAAAPHSAPGRRAWLLALCGGPATKLRQPWTADDISWLLRQCRPKRKKPGLDGWTVAELRLLPEKFLGWMAEFFEAVEAVGE
ncbi:unnamed protein product, partial [Prorocentrum cordatum]